MRGDGLGLLGGGLVDGHSGPLWLGLVKRGDAITGYGGLAQDKRLLIVDRRLQGLRGVLGVCLLGCLRYGLAGVARGSSQASRGRRAPGSSGCVRGLELDGAAGCDLREACASGQAHLVVAAIAEALLVERGQRLSAEWVAADAARLANKSGNKAGILHGQLHLGGVF